MKRLIHNENIRITFIVTCILLIIGIFVIISCRKEKSISEVSHKTNLLPHNCIGCQSRLTDSVSIKSKVSLDLESDFYDSLSNSYGFSHYSATTFGELYLDSALIYEYQIIKADSDQFKKERIIHIPTHFGDANGFSENGISYRYTYYTIYNEDSLDFASFVVELSAPDSVMYLMETSTPEKPFTSFTGSYTIFTTSGDTIGRASFTDNTLTDSYVNENIDDPEFVNRDIEDWFYCMILAIEWCAADPPCAAACALFWEACFMALALLCWVATG